MRISDWSSDVCSSDLPDRSLTGRRQPRQGSPPEIQGQKYRSAWRMAPPANRRSGFSRRAQYTTFFSYTAGAVAVVVGLVLLVVSIVSPGTFAGLRGAAADADRKSTRLNSSH